MTRKAQVAIEYIIIFGIGLLMVGLLWVFVSEESQRTSYEVQLAYTKNALNKIVDTADIIAIQGPPAQTYINPYFPENIQNIYIQGNEVIFEIAYGDIVNNLSSTSIINLTGSLSSTPGSKRILIKAVNNYVEISNA